MTDLTAHSLGPEQYRDIILRRDPRYDGRIYFGVSTTRIYCRPICPARPKPENIRLFKSPAEAERAGFRPCRRCRPDAAPGSTSFDGAGAMVTRALRMIEHDLDDDLDIAGIAARIGVTDRHLRRLFDSHLGASPHEILTSKRLHLARQLLQQTALPVTEIALASGFRSIRRFNEAFRALYHATPTDLRRMGPRVSGQNGTALRLSLGLRLPYDWDMMLAYFARHETHGVERVRDGVYQRFVPTASGYATLELRFDPARAALDVRARDLPLDRLKPVLGALRHMFDCDHNPAHLPADSAIAPAGVRLPGAFDGFETAVTIILGQLVSTEQARKKARDLVLRFGRRLGEDAAGEIFAFPTPAALADQELEAIGMTRARADAIRGLARAVLANDILLSPLADPVAARARILALRGIGPWTSEMIAMRVWGDPDAFPKNDLVIARALRDDGLDPAPWASARAYLTHCLWRDYSASRKEDRS